VKPAPVVFAEEMLTLEFPVFVKVADRLVLLPTFTFPKLRLDTLKLNSWVPATPVPLRAIV
jgi:hypothetical protein